MFGRGQNFLRVVVSCVGHAKVKLTAGVGQVNMAALDRNLWANYRKGDAWACMDLE